MSKSIAAFVTPAPPDYYIDVIRELMAYEALCFRCNPLPRNQQGSFYQLVTPCSLHWSRQTEYPWAVLESELDEAHSVLDISDGHSPLKFALAKRCKYIADTEYDKWYMPTIQQTIDNQDKIWDFNNISLVYSDIKSLPYPDNWFDRVFCISVLEHIATDHLLGLQEMLRVLKPNGLLMLSMDVVMGGMPGQDDNFYVDRNIAMNLLQYLDIFNVRGGENGQVYTVGLGKINISALLVKYEKPNV